MANKKTFIRESGKNKLIDSNKLVATETGNGSGDFNLLFPVNIGGNQYSRLYQFEEGSLFYVQNALWNDGTSLWNKDDIGQEAIGFQIDNEGNIHTLLADIGTDTWFLNSWDQDTMLDHSGVVTSPNPITSYFGIQGPSSAAQNMGVGVNFQKTFPTIPSSFTVTVTSSSNINLGTVTGGWDPQPYGCGIYGTADFSGNAFMYGYINIS